MPRKKAIKRWLVYVTLRALKAALSVLPVTWVFALGRMFGAVAHRVAAPLRRLSVEQIGRSLELPQDQAEKLARSMFTHLGLLVAELISIDRLRRNLDRWVVFADGSKQAMTEAVAEGRGVVAVTAHLGNWELMAQAISQVPFDLATAARANANPYLGAWIVRARADGGVQTLERGGSPKGILGVLRRGGTLAFLIDQDTRVPSVFVPFFGRPAKTPETAARLALRRGLPVIMGFARRRGGAGGAGDARAGHEVRLYRLDYSDIEGTGPEAVEALTARMTAEIEKAVRQTPEQWVWVHQRWKSSPS